MSLSTIEAGRTPDNGLVSVRYNSSWDLLKARSAEYLSQHKPEGNLPYALPGEIAEHVAFFVAGNNPKLLSAIYSGQYSEVIDRVLPQGYQQDMESATQTMDAIIHASVSLH